MAGTATEFLCYVDKARGRSDRLFRLNVFKGTLVQLHTSSSSGKRNVYQLSDINSISRTADGSVKMEISGVRMYTNRFHFDTSEEADRFMSTIRKAQEVGPVLRKVFSEIDIHQTGQITLESLRHICRVQDMDIPDEAVQNMMRLYDGDNNGLIDFMEFFQIFGDNVIHSTRQCLIEWLVRTRRAGEVQHHMELQKAHRALVDIGRDALQGRAPRSSKPTADVSARDTTGLTAAEEAAKTIAEVAANDEGAPSGAAAVATTSNPAKEGKTGASTANGSNSSGSAKKSSSPSGDLVQMVTLPEDEYVPGEIIASTCANIRWSVGGKDVLNAAPFIGHVVATNYRIILLGSEFVFESERHTRHDIPRFFDRVSIPLGAVARIEENGAFVVITCKDFRFVGMYFPGVKRGSQESQRLKAFCNLCTVYAFPASPSGLFAYSMDREWTALPNRGWDIYDPEREFTRQGLVPHEHWRLMENTDYEFVPTYPSHFVVPAAMTVEQISAAAAFRSKRRFPVVTYRAANGAVLLRSAQPMAGLRGKKSEEDEMLLNLYRVRGNPDDELEAANPSVFSIIDARSAIAARGNMLAGKGMEKASRYQYATLTFANIENIHAMRGSLNNLADLLLPPAPSALDSAFHRSVEESGWLRHVTLLLRGSVLCAEMLHLHRASVLVHCSDGWDRTSQMCSLTQMMLDPYFRTIEGFAVLIEKEWGSFGHKFEQRCGHGEDNPTSAERSPIFVQFLDATFQLLSQFPRSFEFNEELLLFLANHLFSCMFGNFLGLCERQRRVELEVREKTSSIWAYVFEFVDQFQSMDFDPVDGPLWPSTAYNQIKLWERYYLRWDPDMHPRKPSGESWHDDWGNGPETLIFDIPRAFASVKSASQERDRRESRRGRRSSADRLRRGSSGRERTRSSATRLLNVTARESEWRAAQLASAAPQFSSIPDPGDSATEEADAKEAAVAEQIASDHVEGTRHRQEVQETAAKTMAMAGLVSM